MKDGGIVPTVQYLPTYVTDLEVMIADKETVFGSICIKKINFRLTDVC